MGEDSLNKIKIDEFKRVSAILGISKPSGITSHDVVDQVRRKLKTRKVGHAGALDPFATGVLVVLVGRYTKRSDQFLNEDKEYKCKILFGISTDTQDPEGEVIDSSSVNIVPDNLKKLEKFREGYLQRVPVFSSVKVQGYKLRELARKAESFEIGKNDFVTFKMKGGKSIKLELPKRKVVFSKFEMDDPEKISLRDLPEDLAKKISKVDNFFIMNLVVGCSKGTYIRQLAEDIGHEVGLPAMLLELERTRVGTISLDQCISIDDLPQS